MYERFFYELLYTRLKIKNTILNFIKQLKETNPNADYNIFKALDNVNLNCILGTKKDGEYTSFLNDYDIVD